jgi:hypothetical protein
MPVMYQREVGDGEFVARVRAHRPSSLMPRVAAAAASHMEPESWFKRPLIGFFTPWALAEIARVSLAYGDEHRGEATDDDVVACNAAYNALSDVELATGAEGSLAHFFLRMSSEQLEYQHSLLHEMSRTAALFQDTTMRREPKVLKPGWQHELFGASLADFVGAGQLLHLACAPIQGRFNPAWLDQENLKPITDIMGAGLLRQIWSDHYLTDRSRFKGVAGTRAELSPKRRFTFNPLFATPVVEGLTDDWLVPVPGVLARKFSPLGVYYMGVSHWGKPFADDLGDLFEQYVGRHLQLIPDTEVLASIRYGRDNRESVDWIVVMPYVVLLVEVKSVRPTDPVRMGAAAASAELGRMLGKAFGQIATTDALIEERRPEFKGVPTDRPRIGVIVTMEDFHTINSPFHRPLYQPSSSVTTVVASASEIEHLVAYREAPIDRLLLEHLGQQETDGWSVKSALTGRSLDRNAVIDAAWNSYPWSNVGEAAEDNTVA